MAVDDSMLFSRLNLNQLFILQPDQLTTNDDHRVFRGFKFNGTEKFEFRVFIE